MNIDVIGRIRPSLRGEGPHTLAIEGQNKINHRAGGSTTSFQYLHGQNDTNYDIYKKSVEPLLDFSIAGYNTCLLVCGESGSGKTYTLSGDSSTSANHGVFYILLQHLFNKLGNDGQYSNDPQTSHEVHMQMYELYNESLRDLLASGGSQGDNVDENFTAEKGNHVTGRQLSIVNAGEGVNLFRQGISKRVNRMTDFGKAQNHSFLLVYIDISMVNEAGMSTHSRMTIVVTPGIEKLSQDWQALQIQEGSTLSRSLVSWAKLISSLANQPHPNRVISYEDSKLTRLLEDELGGNCRTRTLMCFKPHPENSSLEVSLQLAKQVAKVKNFPVSNDTLVQGLIAQYRSKMQNYRQQNRRPILNELPTGRDAHEELRRLQSLNVHLKDENERLLQRFSQMQGNFSNLVTSKTDLSVQLLMTEEEKLKVSKILVEMQIENNKVREELEATKFELKNKILKLEAELTEAELERDRNKAGNRLLQDRLADLEADRKKLADEFVSLKSNYLAVKRAQEEEIANSEELSLELLNLANANAALMRERDNATVNSHHAEVDRVRAIVSRQSHRIKFSDPDNYPPGEFEKDMFEEDNKHHRELQTQRQQHEDDTRKLAKRISELTRDLQRSNQLARERQKQTSELKAKLLVLQGAKDELQSQNNRMQHKLKDVTDDFKARLVKYVKDITEHMKNSSGDKKGEMKQYVDQMLNDVKQAHKTREEQLSQAAQNYRRQLTDVSHKLEKLFVAYRNLRDDVKQSDLDIDLGPDEDEFKVTDQELQSTQQKEINRLRNDLRDAEKQIDSLSLKVQIGDGNQAAGYKRRGKQELSTLRKELKEFTINTQQDLERERAELLTRVAMMEEENKELQDYIDNHLIRYKEEIVRLRDMHGMLDAGGFVSPDKNSRPPRRL